MNLGDGIFMRELPKMSFLLSFDLVLVELAEIHQPPKRHVRIDCALLVAIS